MTLSFFVNIALLYFERRVNYDQAKFNRACTRGTDDGIQA